MRRRANTKCSAEMPSKPQYLPHLISFKASKMLKMKGVTVIESGCC